MVPLNSALYAAYSLRADEIFYETVEEYEITGRVPPKATPYTSEKSQTAYRKGFSDGWKSDPSYRGYVSASLTWLAKYNQMVELVDDPIQKPYACGYIDGADAYQHCGQRAQYEAKKFRDQLKAKLKPNLQQCYV